MKDVFIKLDSDPRLRSKLPSKLNFDSNTTPSVLSELQGLEILKLQSEELAHSAKEFETYFGRILRALDQLENTSAELSKTNEHSANKPTQSKGSLNHVIYQVAYLSVLFKIESTAIDHCLKDSLTQFIEESIYLLTSVSEISKIETKQLFDIQRASFDKPTREKQASARNPILLKKITEEIEASVGDIVICLQAHDIINQRLDHALELTHEILNKYSLLEKSENIEDECKELRFIEKVSTILSNQIDSIKTEIATTDEGICSNLKLIALSLDKIAGGSKPTAKHSKSTLDNRTFPLKENLNDSQNIALSAKETLLKLSSQLHARTLTDNSTKTGKKINEEAKSLLLEVSNTLDNFSQFLHKDFKLLSSLRTYAEQNHLLLPQRCPSLQNELEEQRARCKTSLETMEDLQKSLIDSIEQSSNKTGLSSQLILNLEILQSTIAPLAKTAKARADRLNIDIDITDLLKELLSRYTMESEKSIHLSSLGLEDSDISVESNIEPRQDSDIFF